MKRIHLIVVAVLGAFFLSFGNFFAKGSADAVLRAGRGHLDGASVADRVFAWVWSWGGFGGLGWLEWLRDIVVFTTLLLAIFVAVHFIIRRWKAKRRVGTWVVVVLAISGWAIPSLVFSSIAWNERRLPPQPPVLPFDLVGEAAQTRAFYSPVALLVAALNGARGDLAASARLSLSPADWRKEARIHGWNTVVLSGPLASYRPLLAHLVASPDWRLAKISNTGFIFARDGGTPVSLPDTAVLQAGNKKQTARHLAQLSEKLDGAGYVPQARQAIARALELAPKDYEVLLYASQFAASRELWSDMTTYARRALDHRWRDPHATYMLAWAAFESGDYATAEHWARKIPATFDPFTTRLLLARIYRAQKDFTAETSVLQTLVDSLPEGTQIHSQFLLYLAQSRASSGHARAAVQIYRQALATGLLDKTQAAEVEDHIATIKKNSGFVE